MSNYLFMYHGEDYPETEEGRADVMTEWKAWFGTLGASIVDGGAPVGKSSTVHVGGKVSNDGGSNPVSGYTIVSADNQEAAIELAKSCPILTVNGTVEVAEAMNIDM